MTEFILSLEDRLYIHKKITEHCGQNVKNFIAPDGAKIECRMSHTCYINSVRQCPTLVVLRQTVTRSHNVWIIMASEQSQIVSQCTVFGTVGEFIDMRLKESTTTEGTATIATTAIETTQHYQC